MRGAKRSLQGVGDPRRLASAWMLSVAMAVAPVAAANEYDDFRIPAHDQINWSASLSSSALWNTGSQSYTIQYSDSKRSSVDGSLGSRLSWLSDSDPALTSVFVGADFGGLKTVESRQSLLDNSPLQVMRFEDSFERQFVNERWQAGVTHRRYPWANLGRGARRSGLPVGLTGSVIGSGNYRQQWRDDASWMSSEGFPGTQTTLTRATDASWSYAHAVSINLGLGLGRVRDATGVFEAEVLEQRLLETGALTRPLSPAARQRLAELIYLRGSLDDVRERPARSLWQSVERIVQEDGALGEQGLDGYSVMRAGERLYSGTGTGAEGLPTSPVLRQRGWFVGPTLSSRHTQSLTHGSFHRFREDVPFDSLNPGGEVTSGFRGSSSSDQVLVGGLAEGHWPISSRWQIDAFSETLFPVREEERGDFSTLTQAYATLMIADRWLANGRVAYSRSVERGAVNGVEQVVYDAWVLFYSATVDYYLEDRVALNLGIAGGYNHANQYPGTATNSNFAIQLGVSYRLMGRYHAAGLLDPVNVTAAP